MIELSPMSSADVDFRAKLGHDLRPPDPDNAAVILNLPLTHSAVFYPLGFAVEVITNEEAVLALVREFWGELRQLQAHPALQVRIEVRKGGPSECPPTPVIRQQRNLFTVVADADNHAVCDLANGFSLVWLNYSALQYRKYLCYHFIETAASILITNLYMTAIHAACVSRYGHGMLLSGDSGAGKSSLSYACARAGWTYTSDDGSFLLRDSDQQLVVGDCRKIRFRPSAEDLFPELHGYELTPRVQGKPSIEIPTSKLQIITSEQAIVRSIIFLNRQPLELAELQLLPPGTAIRRFQESLGAIDEFREQRIASLQQFSGVDAYELRYSTLQSAIDRLDLLARGDGTFAL